MGHQIGWGLMLVLLGGVLNGSFAAPMKRLSAWRWENIWLVYAVTGLLILPWVIAVATVPHLGRRASASFRRGAGQGCPLRIRLGHWRASCSARESRAWGWRWVSR